MCAPSNRRRRRCGYARSVMRYTVEHPLTSLLLLPFRLGSTTTCGSPCNAGHHTMQRCGPQKISKLKSGLHFLDAPKQNQHLIFVDDEKEMEEFSAEKYFDTTPDLVNRTFNRPRKSTLKTAKVMGATDKRSLKKMRRKRDASYAELSARVERVDKIARTAAHMDLRKKLTVSDVLVPMRCKARRGADCMCVCFALTVWVRGERRARESERRSRALKTVNLRCTSGQACASARLCPITDTG